jgi:predicted Zn finger-like uncharacterized protein
MRFQCPNCLSVVAIEDSEAGQAVACGRCSSVIVVPASRLAANAVIDDFVIEKEIGKGGLATVYLAHQISLDRPVALKILHEQYSSDEDFITDFIREARAAAQLNHPNIVQAYAVGQEDNIYYFAMEYVQGTTLKNVLTHSGRLVIDRALMITREIAKALDFAWQNKQLVHRDVKPDNIIVTETGQVKLADLGLARVSTDITQSGEGEILGTPQYIAPEMLLGRSADNRTDVYSLGATLYHAVTGQYPFSGNTAGEIARKHISERLKAPKQLVSEIPDPVSRLIEIMMAKRPGQRIQSSADLLDELKRVGRGKPPAHPYDRSYQEPIDLERVDDEMAAEITVDGSERQPKTALDRLQARKARPGTTGVGGRIRISAKGTDKAAKTSAKVHTISRKENVPAPSTPVRTGSGRDSQAPATAEAAPPVPLRPGRRKKSTVFLRWLIALLVAVAVIAVIAVAVIAQHKRRLEPVRTWLDQGLTMEQAMAVFELERFVIANRPYEQILAQAKDIKAAFPASAAVHKAVQALAAPGLEQEARELRRQKHEEELTAWRSRSRELMEEARRLAREQAEAQRQQELEEQRQREREAEAQQQRELEEKLTAERIALRNDVIRMCRQYNFADAKIRLTPMSHSLLEEFRDWAVNKQQTIELAERAVNLVRDSGNLLQGTRISVASSPRPGEIVSVGPLYINAIIRDTIYERGVRQEEEKITPVIVPFETIETPQMLRYIDTAWQQQNGSKDELNLLKGAFLLARGENLALSEQLLRETSMRDQAQPMLAEIAAMRNATEF